MCFKIILRTTMCSLLLFIVLSVNAQLSPKDLLIYDNGIDHPVPIYLENSYGCSELYFLTINVNIDTIRFKISQKDQDESLDLALKIGNIIFDAKNESTITGLDEINKVPFVNGELLSVEDGTSTIELINNSSFPPKIKLIPILVNNPSSSLIDIAESFDLLKNWN